MIETSPATASSHRFVQIDEEGYFKMDDLRVADAEVGRDWLARLRMDERRPIVDIEGHAVLVEAFDEPFIALDVEKLASGAWRITLPYGHEETFGLRSLTLDEWDRFHGRTSRGIPFVFSRAAQARFFNTVDEYDDDTVTIDGETIVIQPWLTENPAVHDTGFWSDLYRNDQPRWELNAPSPALPALVPRLKLTRSRILVAGAGTGNDAAWLAEQGHIVTAVDFSAEAIARAKAKYSHIHDLHFVQADVFALPAAMNGAFDIVFEHTLYCAISPSRRNDLVRVWKRVLTESGHLMAVFFTFDKPEGPPFGGSEWEVRSRLQKSFRPLYWTRLRNSIERRMGTELFVYAQKLSPF